MKSKKSLIAILVIAALSVVIVLGQTVAPTLLDFPSGTLIIDTINLGGVSRDSWPGGGFGVNHDQDLNTTDDVAFNSLNATEFYLNDVNITDDIIDDLVNVSKNNGALVGPRSTINFIEEGTITITVTDDPTNDRINVTISATGGGGGEFSGYLVSSGLSDHEYSGLFMNDTAGENLVIGDIVYINGADGKYYKADCNSVSTMPSIAIATETITADSIGYFLLNGYMRDDSWAGWVGGMIYVSGTAGEMTQTIPTSTGDQVQIVGYPVTTKIIRFDPDLTVVEIG